MKKDWLLRSVRLKAWLKASMQVRSTKTYISEKGNENELVCKKAF
jgi:hypothetical protein